MGKKKGGGKASKPAAKEGVADDEDALLEAAWGAIAQNKTAVQPVYSGQPGASLAVAGDVRDSQAPSVHSY